MVELGLKSRSYNSNIEHRGGGEQEGHFPEIHKVMILEPAYVFEGEKERQGGTASSSPEERQSLA